MPTDGRILHPEFYQKPPLKYRHRGAFNGLTTCVPYSPFLLPAEKVRRYEVQLISRIQNGDRQATRDLNELILNHSMGLQQSLCRVLQEDSENCGLVHGINASELLAETNARVRYDPAASVYRGRVMTFLRGGRVVNKALAGGDIRDDQKVNYVQAVGLLTPLRKVRFGYSPVSGKDLIFITTDHGPIPGVKDGYLLENTTAEMLFEQISDIDLLEAITKKIRDPQIKLAVIPVVDALGRIWPWKKIAHIIDQENEYRKISGVTSIFKILNAVQAIGRVDAEDIAHPLDYYDVIVTVGYKGLGSMMNSAALLARRPVLEKLYPSNKRLPEYIEEFNALYRCPPYCFQYPHVLSGTISLPEIFSFSLALDHYYIRGAGKTFAERRSNMLARIEYYRQQLISQLDSRYFRVLEPSPGVRLISSVVCFGLQIGDLQLTQQIKNEAMQRNPAIILSGNVGPILRLAIPEHLDDSGNFLSTMVNTASVTLNSIARELIL